MATAHTALRALPRASSRNLMLLDSSGGPGGGEAVDFENTPRRNAALHPPTASSRTPTTTSRPNCWTRSGPAPPTSPTPGSARPGWSSCCASSTAASPRR
ncbi:hypothetical protein ACFQXA_13265 [Nocardiopsis composta]